MTRITIDRNAWLSEALAKVEASGEVALDFSAVRRIDASVIAGLEKLADTAESKSVQVGLHGVNVDVYKVLKLLKLAQRFSFAGDKIASGT